MAAFRSESRRTPVVWFLAGGGLIAVSMLLAHWVPSGDPRFSICFLRRVLHIACPGCGLTRSLAAIAKGDAIGAVDIHPLGPVLALEGVVLWSVWGVSLAIASIHVKRSFINYLLIADASLLLVVWLVRLSTGTLPS